MFIIAAKICGFFSFIEEESGHSVNGGPSLGKGKNQQQVLKLLSSIEQL